MSNLWDKKGIPHKGWKYQDVIDLGEGSYYEKCQMCGKEELRYVHILYHDEYPDYLRVGCVCAQKLTDDYSLPETKERELKNRLKRKQNFLKREWKLKPAKGTYSLKYKGEFITIFPAKFGGFGIVFQNIFYYDLNGKKFYKLEEAKEAAFEIFDNNHEPQY